LSRLPGLSVLALGCSQITDQGLERLTARDLVLLNLTYSTGITPAGWRHVLKFKNLAYLYLWNTSITEDTLKELSSLQKIEILCINGCPQITDVGLEHLKRMEKLRTVSAIGTKITEAGVRRFHESRPEVKILLREGQ